MVRNRNRRAGFTLVELMVVITIIAILATIVGVNVIGQADKAAVSGAQAQIQNFKTALIAYRLELNKFPSTSEGLHALIENSKSRKFLDATEIPMDPWGNEYRYTSESASAFTIVSYGADGIPGGTGFDADINSENLGANR